MDRTTWLQDRRMQKFRDVLSRWERKELSGLEAGEILGMSDRQFRRYRVRYEEEGLAGLVDRRLGAATARRVPVDKVAWMLAEYRTHYLGWNVKHFHEHLREHHGFRWGYTWTKTQLHTAGLVERAARRGAHRRKRPRKPCEGMMLHQDGSRFAWLAALPQLDLIVTMDDATSRIYSAFLVEEEGTASTFRALLEVFTAKGLPSSLYTDRGSHYFVTPKAGQAVDKSRLTQVGRALDRLGIEHIPAYSPEARGRSERMFGTLQDRLPKELKLAGIDDIETANRFIREVYVPAHNARFARPAQLPESAFVPVRDAGSLTEILCIEEERVVARDNTVCHAGHRLQLPASPLRPHYVKAHVKVREYPDGSLAVFHGPRAIARYAAQGSEIAEVPTRASETPCSRPSRRGLAAPEPVARTERRPALTAAARGVSAARQVGTKKRSPGRTKKLIKSRPEPVVATA
ncbi:MAG: ISNCY family transposase [Planctomycetaceae bacterium]|nr:ISNCY family transposase [Planctomycetaceae bacterium]